MSHCSPYCPIPVLSGSETTKGEIRVGENGLSTYKRTLGRVYQLSVAEMTVNFNEPEVVYGKDSRRRDMGTLV